MGQRRKILPPLARTCDQLLSRASDEDEIIVQAQVTILLLTFLAVAACTDLLKRRIPNVLTAPALATGLLVHTLTGGQAGMLLALTGMVAGLAALLPFYLLRGMGAGDVKLMAVVGSFLGPLGALHAAAVTLVLGAVLGVGILVSRNLALMRAPAERFAGELPEPGTARVSIRTEKFPYAVAIAGGTVFFMWHQGQLAQLVATLVG
jgi:prepilin peptidase CpaA